MKYNPTNGGMLVALEALLLLFTPTATVADEPIAELRTRTATYTNVTVTRSDGTNIYIMHAGGMTNVKLDELAPDVRQSLGYAVATSAKDQASAPDIRHQGGERTPFIEVEFTKGVNLLVGDREIRLGYSILAGMAVGYLLFCCCSFLLCKKTGNEPGILIWFPVLQLFPLLRAAGMSGWWFLACFIPVLNLVAWMGWCVNIVITLRKSLWWALLLIMPVTNVIAFLYLALARSE